jgi:cytochrome c peroxidase
MLNSLTRSRSYGLGLRLLGCAMVFLLPMSYYPAAAQTPATAVLKNTPTWLPPVYRTMINVGLPASLAQQLQVGAIIPQTELDSDPSGILGTYQPGGATFTETNPFFLPLGTNGRTCATCHQPVNAMGMSVASVNQRLLSTLGTDPLFAPVDGANCPNNGGSPIFSPANYSLLLNYGLIRIPLPVPQNAEFTISVVSDPYGCNTNSTYNQSFDPATNIKSQIISLYRRPIMSANLKYKVTTGANTGVFPPIDLVTGAPLAIDPATGEFEGGNIMSDGREPTLTSQALDAILTHAQATTAPTATQLAQIVAFESGIFTAQTNDIFAGSLTTSGATGGPVTLSTAPAGVPAAAGKETISSFDSFGSGLNSLIVSRASIYRGQQLFNNKTFLVTTDEGINNIPGFPPGGIAISCAGCHSQTNGTTETHPIGQHSIGIGGMDVSKGGPAPSTVLPIFKVTCKSGYSTPFSGSVIVTNDPGKALISGRCADIGRFSTPQLHGLTARSPYFHDGSVSTLTGVVNFYNKRFNIGFTAQETADLVAFLSVL